LSKSDLRRKKRTRNGDPCRVLWGKGWDLVAGTERHEDSQDIPEEEGDTREEPKRGGDVLVRAVVMNDVAGLVEDGASGEEDHGPGEPDAQIEAHEDRGNDEADGNEGSDFQHSAEEGEVLFRGEGDEGEACKESEGDEAGLANEIAPGQHACARSNEEEGQEDDGFGDDIETEAGVLHATAGVGGGPLIGKPGGSHEEAEDDEPRESSLKHAEDGVIDPGNTEKSGF
jgi:hypothetical protein